MTRKVTGGVNPHADTHTAAVIGVTLVEVDRPDRKSRRSHGKSDPVDAQAAARAALSGRAAGVPKSRNGRVETTRVLRVARSGAVKAHVAAQNSLSSAAVCDCGR
jgi:transposase